MSLPHRAQVKLRIKRLTNRNSLPTKRGNLVLIVKSIRFKTAKKGGSFKTRMDHTVKNRIIASVCFCFVTQDLKSLDPYTPCSWVNTLISILRILRLGKPSQRWSVGAKAAVDQPQHCEQNPQILPPPPLWPPARPGSRWLIPGQPDPPRSVPTRPTSEQPQTLAAIFSCS